MGVKPSANSVPTIEYLYDGTFPGLLTAIFHAFNRKESPDAIVRPNSQRLLFASPLDIETDPSLAQRVWSGVERVGGDRTCKQLYYAFLSQHTDVEILILLYCRELFRQGKPIATDLASDVVLPVHKLDRKVLREAHRSLMFIRFEQAADGTYFAPFAPKYDVIPLVIGHFRARFTDQHWLIYDTQRNYGFLYNGSRVEQVTIDNPVFNSYSGQLPSGSKQDDEDQWQDMWRTFFKNIAIAERKNYNLQRNFMPKRFWKHLTEKRRL